MTNLEKYEHESLKLARKMHELREKISGDKRLLKNAGWLEVKKALQRFDEAQQKFLEASSLFIEATTCEIELKRLRLRQQAELQFKS